MTCGYSLRLSAWGYSLFHNGALVASANDQRELVGLVAMWREQS